MVVLRAEKTTRNNDDFKVLIVGILLSIFLMLFAPMILRGWDQYLSNRPFVKASLEIVGSPDGPPSILYDADALKAVDGFWIASIIGENDDQITTVRGEGSYNSDFDSPRYWSWSAFFDNGKGLNSPGVPNVPFKVCVRYVVTARSSGVSDETPQYCSSIYDPRG